MSEAREPYTHEQLARLLSPKSIAVVGATERAGAFGERVLAHLSTFPGPVFPVNARYAQLGGKPCFTSVAGLPEPPDLAVICVSREHVAAVAAECAAAGVGGAIVLASGYAETGKPGRAEEQAALGVLARSTGMRIVGPNTIGVVLPVVGAVTTFLTIAPPIPPPSRHAIGIVSQSGAIGMAMAQASSRGVAFSHVLTSGNSCDVDMADYVSYLAADLACDAIACALEGMAAPSRLLVAADRARAAGKTLVVFKMASGDSGAVAALSHTGSLAGSDAAYRAALARAGAVVVDDLDALVETAAFFAKVRALPRPRARAGLAVLATSGGAAIMAADRAEQHGVPMPQPSEAARKTLEARIPEFGSPRNPVDVTAQVITDPESFGACFDALLDDPAYGALLVPHVYASDRAAARLVEMDEHARPRGRIACVTWHSEWMDGPGCREAETSRNLALFRSVDHCVAAVAAWLATATPLPARPTARLSDSSARDAAAALIAAGTGAMTERQSKEVLALYGVPVTAERVVRDADEACAAAEAIGFPVVLKAESADLPHKSEAGVVALDLRDDTAVRVAYARIAGRAAAHGARLDGVLVQPMIPPGVELMVGARVDPLFGPLVVVGFGGVLVELLRDTVLLPAPVSVDEARAMLARLRGASLLDGFRGLPAVDRGALADIVARVSELAADHAATVSEIDVNPLIATANGLVAVDGLIVRTATIG